MKSRKSAANAAAAVLLALSAATAQGQTGGEQFSGFVWNDLNADGIQDSGEPGILNVTVQLLQSSSLYSSTTTDAGGSYLFGPSHFSAGNFNLHFVLPPSYFFSPQNVGSDLTDSDADPNTGLTAIVFLNSPSQSSLATDFDAGMHVAQVPEPGTLALLGLGAAGLLAGRRRKRTG